MRRKEHRSTETSFSASAGKVSLRNLGDGMLEFTGNTVKFYVENGRFKKRKQIAREIQMTDVESVNRAGNELSITWKGVTDTFTAEETALAETICQRITEALKEQRKTLEDEEAAKQENRTRSQKYWALP